MCEEKANMKCEKFLDMNLRFVHNRRHGDKVQQCTKEADRESERERANNNPANAGEEIKGGAKGCQ